MKIIKGISLFFVYPVLMFVIGFYVGIKCYGFFYPGQSMEQKSSPMVVREELVDLNKEKTEETEGKSAKNHENEEKNSTQKKEKTSLPVSTEEVSVITADTEYILEEADLSENTIVETKWNVPQKYIGMNREEFLAEMKEYELTPPLSELERGFVSVEVRSFAADRIVVRMNYVYMQPSEEFYLAAQDNYVVVYCDDKETIYMNTDILLETLPDELQQKIINMMYIANEEALYNFLESYSS